MDPAYLKTLALDYMSKNKFYETALIILQQPSIQSDFDVLKILDKLVDLNKGGDAKRLCYLNDSYKYHLIDKYSSNENCKKAADLVLDFKMDINEFPSLKERLCKNSMRYHLGLYLYKKPSDEDYMSLFEIEDLFIGLKPMLCYLVEDLVHKKKINEAKGICDRHNLIDVIRADVKEEIEDIVYDPSRDKKMREDVYGPITKGTFMNLPQYIKVDWVATEQDIPKLDQLLDEPYIGVDSEWRPAVVKFHKTNPALFQIGGAKVIFLIDFVALKNSKALDEKLTQVFSNDRSTIVGFSFNSDIQMYSRKFPHLTFYRFIQNFVDAQPYYAQVYGNPNQQTGLAKVALAVFDTAICKGEQISNWEKRPLRLS